MTTIRMRAVTAMAAAVTTTGAFAHGGHPVPAGMPAQGHLHLTESVLLSGPMLLGLVLAGAAIGAVLWRRRGEKARHGAHRRTR